MEQETSFRARGRRPGVARARSPRSVLTKLYEAQTPHIRGHLQRFGVRGHDLDDLVQEVFLVLHAKRELVVRLRPLDPWLREVCRRVAAGHRRRAHRRREVTYGEPLDTVDDSDSSDAAFELEERQLRLHRAMTQLDEYSRDLVALHEVGDLPLVDMAQLIAADRKTVRKRLGAALRRLTTLIGAERGRAPSAGRTPGVTSANGRPRRASEFRVLARHPAVSLGLVGSVLIAVWPGAATLEALELVEQALDRVTEICGGSAAFFAVVEASTRPPDLAGRKKLIALLEDPRRRLSVYAAALEGGGAWLVRPIMSALAFLARPRFAMQYFEGVPRAVTWLADNYPELTLANESALLDAVTSLRSPSEVGEGPTANNESAKKIAKTNR